MEMIGHNKGPVLDPSASWRKLCWSRARRDLLGAKVPIEIVRLRVKRAKALGLTYPQYASVLLGSGRDITGFLFTVNGLQLKLARQLELPDYVKDKLSDVEDCAFVSLAPGGKDPALFKAELSQVSGIGFDATECEPSETAGWAQTRTMIQDAFKPMKLPPKSVVMIGDGWLERDWSMASKLAKFFSHKEYFAPPASAGLPD